MYVYIVNLINVTCIHSSNHHHNPDNKHPSSSDTSSYLFVVASHCPPSPGSQSSFCFLLLQTGLLVLKFYVSGIIEYVLVFVLAYLSCGINYKEEFNIGTVLLTKVWISLTVSLIFLLMFSMCSRLLFSMPHCMWLFCLSLFHSVILSFS